MSVDDDVWLSRGGLHLVMLKLTNEFNDRVIAALRRSVAAMQQTNDDQIV